MVLAWLFFGVYILTATEAEMYSLLSNTPKMMGTSEFLVSTCLIS